MTISPNSGIVAFGTFTPPSGATDGIQGEVPAPLATQTAYYLTPNGWAALSGSVPPVVQSVTTASSVSVDISAYQMYIFTALASTLTFSASTTGSPVNGTKLLFRVKDNGTPQTLTWTTSGAGSYRAIGIVLPTTTVASKTTYVACIYNSTDAFWDVVAAVTQA